MRYVILLITDALLLSPVVAQSQAYYGGYSKDGYYGGYYGYEYFSSTAEEGYGRGLADVIRGQGLYNQLTAEAESQIEESRRKNIENRLRAMRTYFEIRRINSEQRDAERAARRQQTLEWLRNGQGRAAPRYLSASQLDPTTGALTWPSALQDGAFAEQRRNLNELFRKRAERDGILSTQEASSVKENLGVTEDLLRKQIRQLHVMDYIDAKRFIEALANETFRHELE